MQIPDLIISDIMDYKDLHLFASSQPDLNWDTPAVRDAVFDVVKFWADNGADGFRVGGKGLLF